MIEVLLLHFRTGLVASLGLGEPSELAHRLRHFCAVSLRIFKIPLLTSYNTKRKWYIKGAFS